MDSDDGIFITQNKFILDSSYDTDGLLDDVINLEYQRGYPHFSDISDEELVNSCDRIENEHMNNNFATDISDNELVLTCEKLEKTSGGRQFKMPLPEEDMESRSRRQ